MKNWHILDPTFESEQVNIKLKTEPWTGHRNFAYDLVHFLQPSLIVELGSHMGCSLFSFAQAIKDFKLGSKLIAVDTWRGDEHAGFYEEEVFASVNKIKDTYFPNIDLELKRKFFSEALFEIEDESIELLHIDGLHTYDAVKNDFETWLPKLKPNGIVLFHDTADYTGYESHTYWTELKKHYPNMEFQHNWGLGILFPKGDALFRELTENQFDTFKQLYYYKALYEETSRKLEWQKEQSEIWHKHYIEKNNVWLYMNKVLKGKKERV